MEVIFVFHLFYLVFILFGIFFTLFNIKNLKHIAMEEILFFIYFYRDISFLSNSVLLH